MEDHQDMTSKNFSLQLLECELPQQAGKTPHTVPHTLWGPS